MSESCSSAPSGTVASLLSLAAAPTFAIMALLSAVIGSGAPDYVCSAGHASFVSGMAPTYALMTAFHATPWLKLISNRGRTSQIGNGRA